MGRPALRTLPFNMQSITVVILAWSPDVISNFLEICIPLEHPCPRMYFATAKVQIKTLIFVFKIKWSLFQKEKMHSDHHLMLMPLSHLEMKKVLPLKVRFYVTSL
mmetsp:Transcript_119818/g.245044  ORF Transcript_119818/g.245044 Transcript_119818/m.245044 type:complete len:105 (-) Transcript_119818:2970-3284(-)